MTTKGDPAPGTAERIGAYRVVRRLATGGTSDVLLAKAEGPHGFERTVVLKVLLSHFGKDDEVARMFAREAAAYARLSHPAIVRLFDFFAVPAVTPEAGKPPPKDKGGQLVMVLEYVDGPPLARLKSMVKAIGKELDDKASIYVAICIFSALAAAHAASDDQGITAPVIHRDVNPSNVLIPWDGYPKLADFGVAKVTGVGHQSVAGMIKGTYGYMAPEQVTGSEAVTPRADVYAAGIILWELLTRRRAFQRGALPEIEALRAMAEPRLPALESIRSDVDRTVREALRRALEPRASSRKITAEEMVSILTTVVPLDQGRERLLAILGLVRNDSRAANAQASIAPPAMAAPPGGSGLSFGFPDIVIPGAPRTADFGAVTMHGVAPPATVQGVGATPSRLIVKAAPPRPSSARMQAAAPVPAPSEPSVRELLALPTRPAMPAVTTAMTATAVSPPFVSPPPVPQRPASRPQLPATAMSRGPTPSTPSEPPRRPSAAERLAGAIPDAMKGALDSITPARPLSILDSLSDSMPPSRMSAPPDSPRTSAPLKDLTGGLGLRDAIDEIMKGASSRGLPAAAPVPLALDGTDAPAGPTDDDPKPVMRETTRVPADVALALIGQIPPSPAPMQSPDFPPTEADTKPKNDVTAKREAFKLPNAEPVPDLRGSVPDRASRDDFPNAHDAPDAPEDTVVQPEPIPPPTPRMNPIAKTLAMEARPPIPAGAAAPNPAQVTGPMPRYTPPPPGFHAAPAAPTPIPTSQQPTVPPQAYRPSAPPRMSSRPPAPAKKGVGVGTVAVLLVLLIALGIAGTVGFVRYQATREKDAGVPSAKPTVSVVPVATSAAPAVSVSAEPPASASASASVTASASAPPPAVPASASASPSASASSAPVAGVPEGMGVVRTPNAAPGRRIFVDDKVSGQTPDSVTVKCGARVLKLGSSGKPQNVDVPCGGEIVVGDPKP